MAGYAASIALAPHVLPNYATSCRDRQGKKCGWGIFDLFGRISMPLCPILYFVIPSRIAPGRYLECHGLMNGIKVVQMMQRMHKPLVENRAISLFAPTLPLSSSCVLPPDTPQAVHCP